MRFLIDNALSLLILMNLPQIEEALNAGSIVTFEPGRLRIRRLPVERAARRK